MCCAIVTFRWDHCYHVLASYACLWKVPKQSSDNRTRMYMSYLQPNLQWKPFSLEIRLSQIYSFLGLQTGPISPCLEHQIYMISSCLASQILLISSSLGPQNLLISHFLPSHLRSFSVSPESWCSLFSGALWGDGPNWSPCRTFDT